MASLNVVIDPSLFAVRDDEDLIKFSEKLLACSSLLSTPQVVAYGYEHMDDVLYNDGYYPDYTRLKSIQSSENAPSLVSVKDIASTYRKLRQRIRPLSREVGVTYSLLEKWTASPPLPTEGFGAHLKEALQQLTLLQLVCKQNAVFPSENLPLLTAGEAAPSSEHHIDARVAAWDLRDGELDIELPNEVTGKLLCVTSPSGFYSLVQAEDLWASEPSIDCYEFALSIELSRFMSEHREEQEPLSFSFGHYFVQSCRHLDFDHDLTKVRSLLRACIETICKLKMPDTHWLREDSGPSSRQRKKGQAAAWRRDISDEFHLHYWATSTSVEFSKVVVHNDMTI